MTHWVGTWSQGISDHSFLGMGTGGRSLRAVVRTSLGGSAVRVRFSNRFGGQPIRIDAASVALASEGGTVHASSLREVRFKGQAGIRLEPGTEVRSDPVALEIPPLARVAVSMYFAEAVRFDTANLGQGKMFYSPPGKHVMEAGSFQAFSSIEEEYPLPFIAGIEVLGADSACAVVAFGDSITALGWPAMLAERLIALGLNVGVLDQGLGGNRVLHAGADQLCLAYGPAGVTRFQQDVLAHAGVRHVLVLHGINDIGHPGSVAPLSETVSAQEIFSGLIKYAEWSHAQGVRMHAGTLLPFGGSPGWSPALEGKRQALNDLIRGSRAFDHAWDLDAALRDPTDPIRMLPAYDSGDGLHPGPRGLRAIADAVDVGWFK